MLKSWFHRRERWLAMRDANRLIMPFEWGIEFVSDEATNLSPNSFFHDYAESAIKTSDDFFYASEISDFELTDQRLTWTSSVHTTSIENNTVRAKFFQATEKQKLNDDRKAKTRRAVIVLPHWNAPPESYVALCKVFNRVGISALRLTLPYHEERRPSALERAEYLVCANIGRTLQSVRQAVLDTRAAIQWLKQQGYERIGIVGTSIGSCVAFLAFLHDSDVNAAVFNHASGYFADVVWQGISTAHIRAGLERDVTLEELRQYWLPISPLAFVDKLKAQPPRPMRFIYAQYDLTFPPDLSRQMLKTLKQAGVAFDKTALSCGHYTLGEPPFVYIDGWKIISYLVKHL